MKIQRNWVTPLTIGVFILMAATGILMFFRVHRGLNSFVHEWLGWVMVAGVAGHAFANLHSLRHHLYQRRARWIIGAFVVVLGLSFFKPPAKPGPVAEPDHAVAVRTLARLPLTTLAPLGGQTPTALRERLQRLGIASQSDNQTLEQLVGPALSRQVDVISSVLPLKAPPAADAGASQP